MAREGAAVCVVANRNVQGGRGTVEEIVAVGGRAVFVEADVSASADCERVVAAALEAFGRVDALINNAGITRATPLLARYGTGYTGSPGGFLLQGGRISTPAGSPSPVLAGDPGR